MKKHITTGILVLAAAGSFAILGCSKKEAGSASTGETGNTKIVKASVNSICPISGEKVDGEHTVEFQGKTVGMCCGDCKAAWDKLTDEQKSYKLAHLDEIAAAAEKTADEAKDKAGDAADKAKDATDKAKKGLGDRFGGNGG